MKRNLIFPLVALLLATSCVSVKKQRSRAHDFLREHPEELAELCADRFPPMPVYKPGETIILRDTVTTPATASPAPR